MATLSNKRFYSFPPLLQLFSSILKVFLVCTAQQPGTHAAVSVWPGTSYSFPNQPVNLGSVAIPVFAATFPVTALPNKSVKESAYQQLQSKLSEQVVDDGGNLESFGNQMLSSTDGTSAQLCPSDDNNHVIEAASKTKKKVGNVLFPSLLNTVLISWVIRMSISADISRQIKIITLIKLRTNSAN